MFKLLNGFVMHSGVYHMCVVNKTGCSLKIVSCSLLKQCCTKCGKCELLVYTRCSYKLGLWQMSRKSLSPESSSRDFSMGNVFPVIICVSCHSDTPTVQHLKYRYEHTSFSCCNRAWNCITHFSLLDRAG